MKRQPLKHNVIDRDKVVVPPNWDSWGKIRVLRDGFDVEAVSNGWSSDIEDARDSSDINSTSEAHADAHQRNGAVVEYEKIIRDPSLDALQATSSSSDGTKLEVASIDPQAFLASQLEVLEKLRASGEAASGIDGSRPAGNRSTVHASVENGNGEEGRVHEHIGPVQFNLGGIQVDGDEMVKRLKVGSCCSRLLNFLHILTKFTRIVKDTRHLSHSRLVYQLRLMGMASRRMSSLHHSLLV